MTAAEHDNAVVASEDPDDAARHFLAALELRRAEESACAGASEDERDLGPFAHRERISAVEILHDRPSPKELEQPVGVAVYLTAVAGLTEQWVGRLIECNLAHRAANGAGAAAPACPLSVGGSRVELSSTRSGYRIALTSKDSTVARSLIDRCRSLAN